jgi:hypothetical protein
MSKADVQIRESDSMTGFASTADVVERKIVVALDDGPMVAEAALNT